MFIRGIVSVVWDAAIMPYARQQEAAALSTSMSQHISLYSETKEAVRTRRFKWGTGFVQEAGNATSVLTDSQGGIKLVIIELVRCLTKHFDVWYHFAWKTNFENVVKLEYCCTNDVAADFMAMLLGQINLENFLKMCGPRHRKEIRQKRASMERYWN